MLLESEPRRSPSAVVLRSVFTGLHNGPSHDPGPS